MNPVTEPSTQNRIILPRAENATSQAEERRLLEDFLKGAGLIVPESFLKTIAKDDILEVYSAADNRQLYSNREFMRICSYSIEQMQTIPFQKLFWRSDEIQNRLLERAASVVRSEREAVSWGIEAHELVESLHPRRRTFEMSMRFIAPCFDASGACVAWVSSLQVQLIYEWPEEV